MSATKNGVIENAEEVIERFGGIRPMAKKIAVAVTTGQGWKKRNAIPAGRRSQILEAAQAHDVDLSDLIKIPARNNDNEKAAPASVQTEVAAPSDTSTDSTPEEIDSKSAPSAEKAEREKAEDATETESAAIEDDAKDDIKNDSNKSDIEEPPVDLHVRAPENIPAALKPGIEALDEKLAEAEKKAVTKSTWINLALLALGLGAVAVLLWPQGNRDRLNVLEKNVGQIQSDVDAVKDKQSFLGTLIPDNLDEKIAGLQTQAEVVKEQAIAAKEGVGEAVRQAQVISEDVLGENAGNLGQRMERLQTHMDALVTSPQIAGLLERFTAWQGDENGQTIMDRSVQEISSLIENMNGDMSGFSGALDSARTQSTALGQSLDGVPAEDLKAAALLLGMTQMRTALNRDNAAFDDDLGVLLSLVGEDHTELRGALERMAPHAESGVLTPTGLSNEFRSMAGDVVVASLKGEDVSLKEKAAARMNEIFQVEKDGELVTGTPTQATLARTDKLLEEGDLAGAIAQMETLEGAEREAAAPWLGQAHATLAAKQMKAMITDLFGGISQGADGITNIVPGMGPRLVQDKESGINILVPAKNPMEKLQESMP
ncbi:MAG: mitofilin family membrane protein [Alphaproteobacteria bacterium]